jgi:hypothetical protein
MGIDWGKGLRTMGCDKSAVQQQFLGANFDVFGNMDFVYPFLAEQYPGTVDYDYSKLKVAIIDIETECESGFPNMDDPVERVITYSYNSSTRQVLRAGPRILTTGQLDATVANNQTGSVVLDGVTAFTPTVTADCRSATILVTLTVPTTASTLMQTIRVAAGAEQFIR